MDQPQPARSCQGVAGPEISRSSLCRQRSDPRVQRQMASQLQKPRSDTRSRSRCSVHQCQCSARRDVSSEQTNDFRRHQEERPRSQLQEGPTPIVFQGTTRDGSVHDRKTSELGRVSPCGVYDRCAPVAKACESPARASQRALMRSSRSPASTRGRRSQPCGGHGSWDAARWERRNS